MNRKQEVLVNYREITITLERLDMEINKLTGFIGGPRPVHGVQLTGMPRGTNDPEAAMIQRTDIDPGVDPGEAGGSV